MFHHPDCIIPEEFAKRRFVDMETDTDTDDQSECIYDIESDDSSFSAGTSSSFESAEGSIEDTSTVSYDDSSSFESYDSFNGDPCR